MDIRPLSPDFAVSPQIDVADIPQIAKAGYKLIICNRPDTEVPPSHRSLEIQAAAEAAGMTFEYLPVTHQDLTQDLVLKQSELVDQAQGPVFAYCASGTRSSIVWSYGQAGKLPTDDIIQATTDAGYDLAGMRGALDHMATSS